MILRWLLRSILLLLSLVSSGGAAEAGQSSKQLAVLSMDLGNRYSCDSRFVGCKFASLQYAPIVIRILVQDQTIILDQSSRTTDGTFRDVLRCQYRFQTAEKQSYGSAQCRFDYVNKELTVYIDKQVTADNSHRREVVSVNLGTGICDSTTRLLNLSPYYETRYMARCSLS